MKSSRMPKKINGIVEEVFRIYGIDKAHDEYRAVRIWNSVVGDNIAKMTEVEKFFRGTLYVQVLSPSWRTELLFRKKEIVTRLNEAVGKSMVKDIVFK